ncbi:MAG TPA: 3',5'-cyclic-AMP phosphodiesterase [Steroidobacteraceae bacterium]|nr:3',5'-cyclic-AMP phosphodiesterase [Steroidobacteraceae bacterium]
MTVRLVQLTDPHLFGSAAGTLRGLATLRSFQQTLAAASDAITAADRVLPTGDLVQDDATGYAHLPKLLGELGKPIWCIPGNHDDVPAMRRALAAPPFVLGGHADLGAWRVIMLDSTVPNAAHGELSAASLSELASALETAPQRPALICLHHHPVPMTSDWLDEVGLKNAADFWSVVDRHAHVRAVLWGHVHQSYDALRGGVRLLGTPSTCSQFLPHSSEFALDTLPPGFRTLALQPSGQIETAVHFVT